MLFLGMLCLCAETLESELLSSINADESKAKKHQEYAEQVLIDTEAQASKHKLYAKTMRERAEIKRSKYYTQKFKIGATSISNPTVTTNVNNTNKNDNSTVILSAPKLSSQTTVSKQPNNGFVILEDD